MSRYLGALIDLAFDLWDEARELLFDRLDKPGRSTSTAKPNSLIADRTEDRALDEVLLVALEDLNLRAPGMDPDDASTQRTHLLAALAGNKEHRLIAAQVLKNLHVETEGAAQ